MFIRFLNVSINGRIMETNFLHVYGKEIGLHSPAYAGYRHFSHADSPLDIYCEPCLVISYVVSGEQTLGISDRKYRLRGNDVLISLPDEVRHSCGRPREKCLLYYLAVSPPKRGSLLDSKNPEAEEIWHGLTGIGTCQLKGTKRLKWLFEQLLHAIEKKGDFRQTRVSCFSMEILLQILEIAGSPANNSAEKRLGPVLSYINAHIKDNISIRDCAREAKLSVPRFHVFFKEGTGMPPQEFILREKINCARKMLVDSRLGITDIAFSLGFSSSQYFSTVFRRFEGRSPNAYRLAECK